MKRRTFVQLGAVAAAFAALPSQVAQAIETAKHKVLPESWFKDTGNFFLVAVSTDFDYEDQPFIYRAFPKANRADIDEVLRRYSVVDVARGLRWFKVPARTATLFEGGEVAMSGGNALMYVAHNILLFKDGSWREDRKVRDPDGYYVPPEILTTRYKHIFYFATSGDLLVT